MRRSDMERRLEVLKVDLQEDLLASRNRPPPDDAAGKRARSERRERVRKILREIGDLQMRLTELDRSG